jgi:tetratricopeptide (TPR) repeat protein
MAHLGKGELADLLAGRLDAAGRQRAFDHLHSGCSFCQQHLRALAELLLGEEPWRAAEPVAEDQYDEAFAKAGVVARSFRIRWRKEMEKLERALTLVDQAPGGLGDESFPWRQAQTLHGWPLCEALLQKSYEARFSDPQRMLNLAQSAVNVAKHIQLERYPWPGFVADLRARAFADLGNAYRVNDRLSEAGTAFRQAIGHLKEGTGEPLTQARVLDLLSSLRRAQRRLDDSITLADHVHKLCIEAGDTHLAGRALIAKGISTHYQGAPREAVRLLQQGSDLLESKREPGLKSSTTLGIIHALVDSGEHRQAGGLLLESGLREAFAAEALNLLKLRWIEGKLHAGLNRPAKAARAFMEVRLEYLGVGQVYDAALVGLELAEVWLRQGQTRDVRKLAKEAYGTFRDLGLRSEAARALHYWKNI